MMWLKSDQVREEVVQTGGGGKDTELLDGAGESRDVHCTASTSTIVRLAHCFLVYFEREDYCIEHALK